MALNFQVPGTSSYMNLTPRHNNGLFPSEERLYYYKKFEGGECSIPAMSTQGSKVYAGLDSDGSQVYYDTSSPTIAFQKGGKTYYCAKSVTKERISIPAGTYTPSNFKSLVTSFTSFTPGSYRTLANAASVTVNGQTLSLPAGTKIYFLIEGSSPWAAAAIGFGATHIAPAACVSGVGFTNYKVYVVELAGSIYNVINDYCYNKVFATYDAYNITVSSPGITFQ